MDASHFSMCVSQYRIGSVLLIIPWHIDIYINHMLIHIIYYVSCECCTLDIPYRITDIRSENNTRTHVAHYIGLGTASLSQ